MGRRNSTSAPVVRCPIGTWPVEVPILVPADFCRGQTELGHQRDLGGWLEEVFDFGAFCRAPCREKAYNAMQKLVCSRSKWRSVWEYNDDLDVSLETLAILWRDTLVAVGYDL